MKIKQIHSIDEIPRSARVGIYGCGETGRDLFLRLKEGREDIHIDCFIDSKSESILFNLNVLRYDLTNIGRIESLDLIIIASAFWSSICKSLSATTLNSCVVLSSYFIYSGSQLGRLGSFYFSAKEFSEHENYLNDVAQKFKSDSEKHLYKQLISLRLNSSDTAPEYFAAYEPRGTPYIDYDMSGFKNTIIEAGAFDGTDTFRLAQSSPQAHIYAFEPFLQALRSGPNYSKITNNPNITIIEKALDEISGSVIFKQNGSQSSKDIESDVPGNVSLKSVRLDDFVFENNISQIDFIKMDIEGGEISALKGAASTIQKHRPKIAVSLYHRKEDFYEIPALMDELIGKHSLRLGHYTSSFVDSVLYVIPE